MYQYIIVENAFSYFKTVLCHVVNAAKSDFPEFLREPYSETFTKIGHAPQLTLYNDTWKVSFQFPPDSWVRFRLKQTVHQVTNLHLTRKVEEESESIPFLIDVNWMYSAAYGMQKGIPGWASRSSEDKIEEEK